jgi:hypothetical protein
MGTFYLGPKENKNTRSVFHRGKTFTLCGGDRHVFCPLKRRPGGARAVTPRRNELPNLRGDVWESSSLLRACVRACEELASPYFPTARGARSGNYDVRCLLTAVVRQRLRQSLRTVRTKDGGGLEDTVLLRLHFTQHN